MDSQTAQMLSGAFTSVIGLVCNYRQEQDSKGNLSVAHFLTWLADHRHENTKLMLEGNQKLLDSLIPIIQADQKMILEEFNSINNSLVLLLSRIDVFSNAAKAFAPESLLSRQALEALKILQESESGQFILAYLKGGSPPYLQLVGETKPINLDEPRLLEDDLDTLCKLGLLKHSTKQGGDFYRLTREGSNFNTYS